jgi:hypothetical protein
MSQATRWASVADRARLDPTQAGLAAMGHSHVGFQLLSVLFAAANGFVARHHRHAGRVQGGKFALGATSDSQLVGVVIVGRPVARGLDDTATLEVRRLCTTGAPNACSLLLGAARRATGAHGYRRLVTYTLATESCSSLRAAGWRPTGKVAPGSWSCPSRPAATAIHWWPGAAGRCRHELAGAAGAVVGRWGAKLLPAAAEPGWRPPAGGRGDLRRHRLGTPRRLPAPHTPGSRRR